MRLPRPLILIVGTIVILALMIWLANSLLGLFQNLQGVSPVLAYIIIGLVIALMLVLLGAFIYYFVVLPGQSKRSRRSQPPRPVVLPDERLDVAAENLKALRQQLDQVQDEVSRQALLNRSLEIQQNLQRGGLTIAVFGTGSAGKTSLINALVGRMVGEVGATMGTTTTGATHKLKLKGIDRDILIADTPGILEAGDAGTEREREARRLATEADLLLFVLDGDLRQSEYKPLVDLITIGKRSIVVLNKIDLLTESDLEIITNNLRDRLTGAIGKNDVIAVCANPRVITLDTGERLKPDPDIMPLIKHIAAVVRSEGDDLLADNILLQSQRLGDETRRVIDSQRKRDAEKIVDRFQWIGAGVIAVTPLPVIDVLATAAVNAQMVVEIGKVYGCEINAERGRELALSLAKTLVSLGVVKGAITIVTTALQVSVAGIIAGRAIQGVSAAYLTRIAGKSFIEYFRQDQDWGDGGIAKVVQEQFQLERKDEFVKSFIKDAMAKVVKPLQMQAELVSEADAKPQEPPLQPRQDWAGQEIPPQRSPILSPQEDDRDEWQR
jgi:uncharacterized protein